MLDQVGPRVAQVDQPVGERVGRKLAAGNQLERRDGAERGDQALHRRQHGRDDDERTARAAEPMNGVGAPGRDLGGGADALVRERFPRRQERDTVGAEVGGRLRGELLRLVGTGSDDQDRRVQRARQTRDDGVLARLRVRQDGPGTLQQEPFERLGRDERLQRAFQGHPTLHSISFANRSGQHEQASPLRDGASPREVYRRAALRGYCSEPCIRSAAPSPPFRVERIPGVGSWSREPSGSRRPRGAPFSGRAPPRGHVARPTSTARSAR